MTTRKWVILIGVVTISVLALGGYAVLSRTTTPSFTAKQALAQFTEKGVNVQIAAEQDQSGQVWLASTFTPTQPRFHLYSLDLPLTGISGVGRPTRLELIAPADLKPIGPLQADRPVQDLYFDVLQQSFPVYPDGAVTVRLPIAPPDRSTLPVEVAVTYMACSDTTCLPPVVNKHISATLHIP